ncbi:MAG: Multifunctional CCA protein [Ignavibacteria bacterium]|nr:Multifunctional CCA protein [Ignavibacteria bacterium]
MKIDLSKNILKEIGRIADENGFKVFVVGGYVRDWLMGKEDNDIDILVIGDGVKFAELTASKFGRSPSAVYEKFGTSLVMLDEMKIEFTSARKESYSKKSRKPIVKMSGLEDDLSRRDFTINAIAAGLNSDNFGEITDLFGGYDDLRKGVIKTPLEPVVTFSDDPLRIMRAIRFASMFNFTIEEKTLEGIKKSVDRLTEDKVVSQERITNEFLKILMSDKPSLGLEIMFKTGVMDKVFPEISALQGVDQRKDYHHKDVFYHTLIVVDNTAEKTDNVWLRFSALVHDIAKPKTKKFIEGTGWTFHGHEEFGARMMKNIFKKMKLPMSKLEYVEKLVRMHLRPIPLAQDIVTDSAVRRLAAEAGEELEDLLLLCRADITSKNPDKVSRFMKNYEIVEKKIVEVQKKDELRNFQSPVRGDEIMEICNIKPGRTVGIIKKRIEEAILEGEIRNEYEAAREYLFKIKDEILG